MVDMAANLATLLVALIGTVAWSAYLVFSALREDPKAAAGFRALAPSCQREYIVWVRSAKRTETRERRLRETLAAVALEDFSMGDLPAANERQAVPVVQSAYRVIGDTAGISLRIAAVTPEIRVTSRQVLSLGEDRLVLVADLDQALAFRPPHLSIYHLTIEPNTRFATAPPAGLPDDDLSSDMLDLITARTAAVGLERYEVSAFARPGHRCVHNLNYWNFGDYLGIGAGAHGKLSFPHRVVRQVRWRDPATYMARALDGQAVSNDEEVSRRALPFEYMLNALRLREGVELARFTERTGLPLSAIDAPLTGAVRRGLIERDGAWLRPTARGFDFLSDLQALFLTD